MVWADDRLVMPSIVEGLSTRCRAPSAVRRYTSLHSSWNCCRTRRLPNRDRGQLGRMLGMSKGTRHARSREEIVSILCFWCGFIRRAGGGSASLEASFVSSAQVLRSRERIGVHGRANSRIATTCNWGVTSKHISTPTCMYTPPCACLGVYPLVDPHLQMAPCSKD